MKATSIALLCLFSLSAHAMDIIEPETKTKFPPTMEAAGKTLACTGVAVRQVYGFDIYGIGHYGAAEAAPEPEATVEEKLAHWIASPEPKAMVIQFVFHADEGNMRQFSEDSLANAGYTGEKRDKFLEVFARDYDSGSKVLLLSEGGGKLSVTINADAPVAWEDADLVRALWQCWLGEKSVLKKRAGLVTLPETK